MIKKNKHLKLQEEISEIQNMKNKLKFKATSEEDKIKKMMEFGQTLKKEISTTNVFFFLIFPSIVFP